MGDDYRILRKEPEITIFFLPKVFEIGIADYQEFEQRLLSEIHYSAIINANLSVGIISILINPLKAHFYTESVICDNMKRFLEEHRIEEVF